MSHRPLVSVSALTIADYLLWTWSANTNHEVVSLLAGLTLLPLLLTAVALLTLQGARLVTARARGRRATAAQRLGQGSGSQRARTSSATKPTPRTREQPSASSTADANTRSRRIAA